MLCCDWTILPRGFKELLGNLLMGNKAIITKVTLLSRRHAAMTCSLALLPLHIMSVASLLYTEWTEEVGQG